MELTFTCKEYQTLLEQPRGVPGSHERWADCQKQHRGSQKASEAAMWLGSMGLMQAATQQQIQDPGLNTFAML